MEQYSAKLTGEPFLYNETKIIAQYLLDGESAEVLKKRNIEENLIQQKRVASVKRTNSAIFRRLAVMNNDLLYEFVNSDIVISKYILVYAIMKTDNLVKDFIRQIYYDKILLMKDYIERIEIDNWFEKIYADSNLNTISDTTKYKLKQVTMKIMMDSGLVIKEDERYRIIIPILNDKFKKLLSDANDIEYYKILGGIVWKL